MDDHHQQGQLHLSIPQFLCSEQPILAPGGGAEVYHPSVLSCPEWFVQRQNQQRYKGHYEEGWIRREDEEDPSPFGYFEVEAGHHRQQQQQQNRQQHGQERSFHSYVQPHPQNRLSMIPGTPDLSLFLAPQPSLGPPPPVPPVPIYSASGFDVLSVLARVVTRPNPLISLGPVDFTTCSFVIVDPRRYDSPIVYCSPSFCALTGYEEREVIGRNCRFLQVPLALGGGGRKGGDVRRASESADVVGYFGRCLAKGRECQGRIVNYRRDGSSFVNLVTVIPLEGEEGYQVGFQVEVVERREGELQVDPAPDGNAPAGKERKPLNVIPPLVMSKKLKALLDDQAFVKSVPITTTSVSATTTISSTTNNPKTNGAPSLPSSKPTPSEDTGQNHPFHLMLLESSPDFVHVVSLKGAFLYVAPSVRRVLGYEPEELLGKGWADLAHREDIVPLMRELKEGSSSSGSAPGAEASMSSGTSQVHQQQPRSIDLLFRARTKMGRYVWMECRGRLHVEPGKGRKAIVLSGRAREMMGLGWEDVSMGGGLALAVEVPLVHAQPQQARRKRMAEREFWGLLGGFSRETLTFLSVSGGVQDVLGFSPDEVVGRGVGRYILAASSGRVMEEGEERPEDVMAWLGEVVVGMRAHQGVLQARANASVTGVVERGQVGDERRVRKVRCWMRRCGRDGEGEEEGGVEVWLVVYRADSEDLEGADGANVDEPMNGSKSKKKTRRMGALAANSNSSASRTSHTQSQRAKGISPAPLVYQIRRADAAVMDVSVSPTTEGNNGIEHGQPLGDIVRFLQGQPSQSSFPNSNSNSNSISSAMSTTPSRPSSRNQNQNQSLSQIQNRSTTTNTSKPGPTKDMFEELDIARGSSWQYELQQLRYANARLEEELGVLEGMVAVAAEGSAQGEERGGEREAEVDEHGDSERARRRRRIEDAEAGGISVAPDYAYGPGPGPDSGHHSGHEMAMTTDDALRSESMDGQPPNEDEQVYGYPHADAAQNIPVSVPISMPDPRRIQAVQPLQLQDERQQQHQQHQYQHQQGGLDLQLYEALSSPSQSRVRVREEGVYYDPTAAPPPTAHQQQQQQHEQQHQYRHLQHEDHQQLQHQHLHQHQHDHYQDQSPSHPPPQPLSQPQPQDQHPHPHAQAHRHYEPHPNSDSPFTSSALATSIPMVVPEPERNLRPPTTQRYTQQRVPLSLSLPHPDLPSLLAPLAPLALLPPHRQELHHQQEERWDTMVPVVYPQPSHPTLAFPVSLGHAIMLQYGVAAASTSSRKRGWGAMESA